MDAYSWTNVSKEELQFYYKKETILAFKLHFNNWCVYFRIKQLFQTYRPQIQLSEFDVTSNLSDVHWSGISIVSTTPPQPNFCRRYRCFASNRNVWYLFPVFGSFFSTAAAAADVAAFCQGKCDRRTQRACRRQRCKSSGRNNILRIYIMYYV